ncbi:MAG: hypothetical protein AAF810_17765 [Cyanobacteria bacterium P01_D01_bin.36]
MPPKPGDSPGKQYEIPQGPVTKGLLNDIESRAHELWRSVERGRFVWEDYTRKSTDELMTVADWVERLRRDRVSSGKCTAETFDRYWYENVFSRMPQDSILKPSILEHAIVSIPESNQWLRLKAYQKLNNLAKFAGVAVDLSSFKGNYGPKSVKPRELPTDEQIEEWYDQIYSQKSTSAATWKRIYARIVVFGLRPSESFSFTLVDPTTAEVIDAKSGLPRKTKAFHPRWADMWELEGDVPNINQAERRKLSQSIGRQLKRYGIPCERYAFRHAWCVRVSVEYKVPVSVASRWAGHSVDVHTKVYEQWIRGDQEERIYRDAIENHED